MVLELAFISLQSKAVSIKNKRQPETYDEKRAILQMLPYVNKEERLLIEALREKLKTYIDERTGHNKSDSGVSGS